MSTTFKQFPQEQQLTEGIAKPWQIKQKSIKEAIKILNANCKQGLLAIKNNGLLWRGFTGGASAKKEPFQFIDTTDSLRTSRDYDNAYMLLMAASKHLAGYPSRTNSLICSSSWDDAREYSKSRDAKAVIPFDGAKVAYISHSDFNETSSSNPTLEKIGLPSSLTGISMREFFRRFAAPADIKSKSGTKATDFTDHKELDAAMAKYSPTELTLFWFMAVADDPDDLEVKSTDANVKTLVRAFEMVSSSSVKNGVWSNKGNEEAFRAMTQMIDQGKVKLRGALSAFYSIMKKAPQDKRFTELASLTIKPKEFGLKLVDYGTRLSNNQECWVAGKAILISTNMFMDILCELYCLDKKSVHPRVMEFVDDQYLEDYIEEREENNKKAEDAAT